MKLLVKACLLVLISGLGLAGCADSSMPEPQTLNKAVTQKSLAGLIRHSVSVKALSKAIFPKLSAVAWDYSDLPCSQATTDSNVKLCTGGDLSSRKLIVVYGDSHAFQWMPSVSSAAAKLHFKVMLIAKPACPIVEATVWNSELNRPFTECDAWRKLAKKKIQLLHPDVLVVSNVVKQLVVNGEAANITYTYSNWGKLFKASLRTLLTYSKKIIVIGNNPTLPYDPVRCAIANKTSLVKCGANHSTEANESTNRLEQNAATSLGASYISVTNWLCDSTLCPLTIGNIFVYRDQWHITKTYISYLQNLFEAEFSKNI